MDPKIKAAWVAELRAGTRAQGSGRLRMRVTGGNGREVERWCCLGVLCDLAERAGVVTGRWVEVGHPVYPGDTTATYAYRTVAGGLDEHEVSVLPRGVVAWAGIDGFSNPGVVGGVVARLVPASANGKTYPVDRLVSLAALNDDGVPFDDVARIIEEEL